MDDLIEYLSQSSGQSVSAIHHVLRSRRRRLTILITVSRLLNQDSPSNGNTDKSEQGAVTVRELAKEITSIEQGISLREATGEPYHNIYTSLIQSHLPRLDNINAIKYDQDRKLVSPDQNLLALSAIAVTSSPLASLLFHADSVDQFAGGSIQPEDEFS